MIKFEFATKEQFGHFMEAVENFHAVREAQGRQETLAETFLWVWEKTGE